MSLASILYAAWRSRQPDPTAHPAWGNLDTEERAAWEHAAEVARSTVLGERAEKQLVQLSQADEATMSQLAEHVATAGFGWPKLRVDDRCLSCDQPTGACACRGDDMCTCGHVRDEHVRQLAVRGARCSNEACSCNAFDLGEPT